MTTQLSLYNGALRELGERKLASLSENTEARRSLDDVYTGALKYCLEQGYWKFALRSSKLDYEPSFTPPSGFTLNRQFEIPADHVRLAKMCTDGSFNSPLLDYVEEAGFWFANVDEIYVSYVSNDSTYGSDMSLWPESYILFVERYLASKVAKRLGISDKDRDELNKELKKAKTDARSKDALQGPTQFLPQGSWVSSRAGGRGGFRDRGSRGQLIG